MLFLYETGRPYQFWMKDMLFAIDILWITLRTARWATSPTSSSLHGPERRTPRYPWASPSVEAAHVLEVVAGA